MNADEVARQVIGVVDRAEATSAWEVWLAAQQDRKRMVTGVDLDQVAEFDALSRIEDPELQAVRADVRAPLTLADLIALRRAAWVPALATRRSWQMQMAMLGRGADWQAVAQRYLQFLDALAGRGKGYRGGLLGAARRRVSCRPCWRRRMRLASACARRFKHVRIIWIRWKRTGRQPTWMPKKRAIWMPSNSSKWKNHREFGVTLRRRNVSL